MANARRDTLSFDCEKANQVAHDEQAPLLTPPETYGFNTIAEKGSIYQSIARLGRPKRTVDSEAQLPLPRPKDAGEYGDSDDYPRRSSWRRPSFAQLFLCCLFVVITAWPRRHSRQPDSVSVTVKTHHKHRNPAYLIRASEGAVATENGDCSEVGVNILKAGGNAVDSAVAATLCIGVLNMFSSGIGGGGFMTVRIPPSSSSSSSEVWTIDFRETAPALSNETMFESDPRLSLFGGLASGVPGELRGLNEAHKRWGSIPWSDLVNPSIEMATGWRVSTELARRIRYRYFGDLFIANPDWTPTFSPGGKLLEEGDIIRRPALARTLQTIADEGADAFYEGPIADSIIAKIQSSGGIFAHADLAAYTPHVSRALEGQYHGRKVYTTHAPGGGPMLVHMLNVLERFDMVGPREGRNGVDVHRAVEAMKYGYAARTRLCDPAFNDDPMRINEVVTRAFGDAVSANITDDTTHPWQYYNPHYALREDHGTSHSSIVDRDGMAVAITSTVNGIFGSQVLDPETGVIMNNEMDDFSSPTHANQDGLLPAPYNFPEPHKRPVSSTTPTIIEHPDGSLYLVIGGSGGSKIFGAVSQAILALDWGYDIGEAVERGRVHDQLWPAEVEADDVVEGWEVDALRVRGHNVTVKDVNRVAAVVNAVVRDQDGTMWAASDSRKNGIAAGY